MGILLIIPVTARTGSSQKIPNGFGVGRVVTTDLAIRHEAIWENIQQQAFLYWIEANGIKLTRQVAQAVEAIINNIQYVSIENTWYSIIREAGRAGVSRKAKVVVTAFAATLGLAADPREREPGDRGMALVVEQYQPF